MDVRAFLTGALALAWPAVAGAVETAAHGAHLARCIGVLEETLAAGAAPERRDDLRALVVQAHEAAAAIDLAGVEAARTVERGRAAAQRAAAEGEGLADLLAGCGAVVRTGAR